MGKWILGFWLLCSSLFAVEPSVYISRAEVMLLPTSGAAYNSVVSDANKSVAGLNLADQNDNRSAYLFAKAMIGVRTSNTTMLATVRGACMSAIGTEGDRTLALGRELRGVVIAADLAQLSPEDNTTFCNWLRGVIRVIIDGRTLISTHEDRPNNWGTHAGASRIAADIYLINHGTAAQKAEAQIDLDRAALIFRAYLGDRTQYTRFKFGDLSWQSNPSQPRGINPVGATLLIDGILRNADGVATDDQRRDGDPQYPFQIVNYVREGMQGVVDQAEMLHRQGYPAFTWESSAIYRAFTWFHDEAHGDYSDNGDESTVFPVNFRYSGRNFPEFSPAGSTRSLGYADWTHGPGRLPGNISDPPTDPPPTPSNLVVTPATIVINQKQFFSPSPQLINVTSDGDPLNFSVTTSQPWVVPTPITGTTPQGVNVSFLTSPLPVGTHNATLTFNPGAKTTEITVNISADNPPPPNPEPGVGQKIEVRVSAGSDDAEERLRKAVSLNDGDTTLVDPLENLVVGIRFKNVGIPRGATITKASIVFVANKAESTFCKFLIRAHSVGNSPTFIASTGNISDRIGTSNGVLWEPTAWVVNGLYETPNLNLVVKNVTDKPDWNNEISFLFRHDSGTGKRVAKNFNSPGNSALLKVEYTVP